jgi:sugar phosphate isomerase/epimerase
MNAWPLSVFLTSLPHPFEEALSRAADLGFTHVDVVALTDRPREHLERLADSGLLVACASLGRDLPDGLTLEARSATERRKAVEVVTRQFDDAALLGATCTYLVPPRPGDPDALLCFADACSVLAEVAARRMVRLCVEPVPGRLLSRADATLDWLIGGLSLLLDVGHCLISGEDVAEVVRRAGSRLGHVHLDDNDGVGDLHWPLFTGRLTPVDLNRCFVALREIGYGGALAFEYDPRMDSLEDRLREGRLAAAHCCSSGIGH